MKYVYDFISQRKNMNYVYQKNHSFVIYPYVYDFAVKSGEREKERETLFEHRERSRETVFEPPVDRTFLFPKKNVPVSEKKRSCFRYR